MTRLQGNFIDLSHLGLRSGEGVRRELELAIEPIELAGQDYAATQATVPARLDVSRTSAGHAFRLAFALDLTGPCFRCLEPAAVSVEVEAREVDQGGTDDEELRSPYVVDERLDVIAWARDAAVLALPAQVLCRPDCAGLCAVCGERLDGAEPGAHEHAEAVDSPWSKLRELKLE